MSAKYTNPMGNGVDTAIIKKSRKLMAFSFQDAFCWSKRLVKLLHLGPNIHQSLLPFNKNQSGNLDSIVEAHPTKTDHRSHEEKSL